MKRNQYESKRIVIGTRLSFRTSSTWLYNQSAISSAVPLEDLITLTSESSELRRTYWIRQVASELHSVLLTPLIFVIGATQKPS